jgi:hypothetical protein
MYAWLMFQKETEKRWKWIYILHTCTVLDMDTFKIQKLVGLSFYTVVFLVEQFGHWNLASNYLPDSEKLFFNLLIVALAADFR